MKRFDSVATTGTALIDRRRLSLTAGVLFVLVVAVNAAFPERTLLYTLSLVVGGVLVVGAGYHRRSVVASLTLGTSPLLGDMTAYLVRNALAGMILSPGRVLFLYSRTPYAVVGAGVLYVLGSGRSRFRRTSPERAES
ncbi:hypothetical protein [Haladaptatus halobius]|uniref:hypothetical protein n=1 Tax=Haladaptatus halobius TaxID=2884875 RepID=UPI001D0BB0D8|nr:hypothetical protein [Haladaptatus halobius]